jgi:hypothetical protein
LTIS